MILLPLILEHAAAHVLAQKIQYSTMMADSTDSFDRDRITVTHTHPGFLSTAPRSSAECKW